jgi:hypothetical protein
MSMDVEAGVSMHVGGDEFVCAQAYVCHKERERERERPVEYTFWHEIKSILNGWAVYSLFWRTIESVNKNLFHI